MTNGQTDIDKIRVAADKLLQNLNHFIIKKFKNRILTNRRTEPDFRKSLLLKTSILALQRKDSKELIYNYRIVL